MTETMIENDGTFPKDAAEKFGKTMKPVFPLIERFFTETAKQVGGQMTLKQRLKFTADSQPVVAGLAMFKSRMEKWENGKAARNANPFFDRDDGPAASREAADPKEPRELARAKQQADNTMRWQIDQPQEFWKQYVDRAIEYYQFDEAQQKTARGILKDAQDKAAAMKTPQWREKVRETRVRLYLTYQSASELSNGPWMHHIETEFDQMTKPVNDLFVELKKRIDALPTTAQRSTAEVRA